MIIFDGYARAAIKEKRLMAEVVDVKARGIDITVAAILFTQDTGSTLYTRLKSEAAERVGIGYQVFSFSLSDEPQKIADKIRELNQDSLITGIIIQKPSKRAWLTVKGIEQPSDTDNQAFQEWWQNLVLQINPVKDVDGLHPETLKAIEAGTWQEQKKVMPATARAVLEILSIAAQQIMHVPLADEHFQAALLVFLQHKKVIVIGKSDIVGKPLFYALKHKIPHVEMIGTAELNWRIEQKKYLKDADVIVSSTGRKYLITDELVKKGVAIIDVGEPMPDVDQASVSEEAVFLTPVPGGVGPMTVICLLENAVELAKQTIPLAPQA